jgi:hypothetical protein
MLTQHDRAGALRLPFTPHRWSVLYRLCLDCVELTDEWLFEWLFLLPGNVRVRLMGCPDDAAACVED